MRVLMIHAGEFSFSVTEETSVAAAGKELTDADRTGSSGDALVCFVSIEKKDEDARGEGRGGSARQDPGALQAIEGADALGLSVRASLLGSGQPAPRPADSRRPGVGDRRHGEAKDLRRSPFGYYKAFKIQAKGHPLSELAMTVTGAEAKDVAADGDLATESKAVARGEEAQVEASGW